MIDTMNPSKDVLALSTTEVDLSPLEEGQSLSSDVARKTYIYTTQNKG